MNFLLDTDTCSAHMRRPAKLAHRFITYTGQLAISAITLGELYAGAYKHSQTGRLLSLISDLLQEVHIIDFCPACSEEFGRVRGALLQQGVVVPTVDLLIASTALAHNLTLITHNTTDYRNVPLLRLDDWLIP